MANDPSGARNQIAFAHPDALTEPEKLLAVYFNSPTVGLGIIDADFRFLAVNHVLAEINGIPAAAHVGRSVREVLGEIADVIEPNLRKVVSTRTSLKIETSGTLPARPEPGHWIMHHLPIPDVNGEVTRIAAVVVETTAQKKLEASVQHLDGKLRKEMDRLQVLLEISGIMASGGTLPQVFPQISSRVRRLLRHEYAGVQLRDAESGLLIRQAEDFPLGKGLLAASPINPIGSPGGRAIEERSSLIFSRDDLQQFESEISKSFLAEGLKSLCCVPLLRPKGPLGVLVLGSTRKNAFHGEDLILLNQVGAQLAVAIENRRTEFEIESLKERLATERKYLEGEIRSEGHFAEIVGESAALGQVLNQAKTVAPSEATVLILGETGTGKELIARAVHRLSHRRNGPFVKLNCAAIPTGLLESELFGHEKGAFTGAINQKVGRMELADGGTFFLDEVGEISMELQPKLLRVLQDQEFERLGSNRTIKVNLRLVAATNRDLAKSMEQHEFRSDLFYRLSVFPIHIPALRQRREDIPLLIRYFVLKYAERMGRVIETIPKETMDALMQWPWPGNVRELENLVERSVILSEGPVLRVPLSELRKDASVSANHPDQSLDHAEREHILRVLRETGGALSGPDGAAHRLGLKRTTLQSKMQRLRITRQDYTTP